MHPRGVTIGEKAAMMFGLNFDGGEGNEGVIRDGGGGIGGGSSGGGGG